MFDECPACHKTWLSANRHADMYVNESGGCVAVMMDGNSPGHCKSCGTLLKPHACPNLQRFEDDSLPLVEVTVRMSAVLDITEKHMLRVSGCMAQAMAETIASKTYATSTVHVCGSSAAALPPRR